MLFAFPLADLLGEAPAITTGDWQDPVTQRQAESHTRPTRQRGGADVLEARAPRFGDHAYDVDRYASVETAPELRADVARSGDRATTGAPPSNVLDRVFAGLKSTDFAPRGLARGGFGGYAVGAPDADSAYLAYAASAAGAPATGSAPTSPPAPGTFQSDEIVDGGGTGEDVGQAALDAAGVSWFDVAIALAKNQGKLKKVKGEIDLVAAMENLSKEIADRAGEIGFGEAKAQIIGENPTVDPPVEETAEQEFGVGESSATTSGSGSGSGGQCGLGTRTNAAPVARDDEFYRTQPIGTTVNTPPGVLEGDYDPNGTLITSHLYTNATYGNVTMDVNGGFTYTPNGQPAAADGFFYRVYDGQLYSCPAYVALPLSHVDLDADSDNDGVVLTNLTEEIEMDEPGDVIGYNKDDDNANGVADFQDTTTAGCCGDSDLNLSVFSIRWNFAALVDFSFEWVITGPIKIWQDAAKTPMPMTFDTSYPFNMWNDWPGVWVEGVGLGGATLELKMLRPNGMLHFADKVKFKVVDVDLDIGDGQQADPAAPSFVEELKEETRGAFTVANLNDTDGDARVDNVDTNGSTHSTTFSAVSAGATTIVAQDVLGFGENDLVIVYDPNESPTHFEYVFISSIDQATKQITFSAPLPRAYPNGSVVKHHGRDEVDLMPIRISKPNPVATGIDTMTLTWNPTQIKLWYTDYKSAPAYIDAPGERIFNLNTMGTEVVYWAEILDRSQAMQDIALTLTYAHVSDVVKATGVWTAESTAADPNPLLEHSIRTAASINADAAWAGRDSTKDFTNFYGGTGLRPAAQFGLRNVILMRFIVSPPGIETEPDVKFDIARERHTYAWDNEEEREHVCFPLNLEEANDDGYSFDEDNVPNPPSMRRIFSIDAPGLPSDVPASETSFGYRSNFMEWVRVSFNGSAPAGNTVSGSRMSPWVLWHVSHTFTVGPTGKFVRTTGDANEVESVNDIGENFIYVL